jgi:hypothetical protein
MIDPQTDESDPVQSLPSMVELCLKIPPYKVIHLEDGHNDALTEIYWYRGQLDAYCLDCGKESIFHAKNGTWKRETEIVNERRIFAHAFLCTRNKDHCIQFFFQIRDKTLMKIGQYPSVADLAKPTRLKYKTVLSKQQFSELNKAVGLAAHGVGIGSFVYLRRIFEFLIDEAHQRMSGEPDWKEENYLRARMVEKIALLKEQLPKFLVENRLLYGILSKGIHELTEQECLDAFPITLMGIELILDEVIAQKEREIKTRQASQMISKLQQELGDNLGGSSI